MRILLVEDNEQLASLIAGCLSQAGFVVDVTATAADFGALSSKLCHAVCIVDLTLPDGDALGVIRDLRRNRYNVPILITSARSAVMQRVAGLEAGADDYLPKPFHQEELVARVRALLRRPAERDAATLSAGAIELDTATGDIRIDGTRLDLGLNERRLLELFIRSCGRVVSKTFIEDALHPHDTSITPNAVEQLVSRLRRRIGTEAGVVVKTVRGNGYCLEILK